MPNLSGKVRFGKVYLSGNYKDCHNIRVFSKDLLNLTGVMWSLLTRDICAEMALL